MGKGYQLLRWVNFGLLVAAALKFIPLLLSLAQGFTLTTEQIAAGLAADRAWALDLILGYPLLANGMACDCGVASPPDGPALMSLAHS